MEREKEFKHISVLFEETVDGLNVQPGGIYVIFSKRFEVKYSKQFSNLNGFIT